MATPAAAGTARTTLMVLVPAVTAALLALHPAEPRSIRELAATTDRWLAVHLGLLVAVGLVALVVRHLLRDIDSRAARASRALLPPAVALYAAFDALIGIATGVLMREAAAMPPELQDGALQLAQRWWDVPAPVVFVTVLGPLTWAVAVGAAARATMSAGAPSLVTFGLAMTAVVFAWGHPGVTGAAAMLALAAAVLTDHRRPRRRLVSGT